MEKTTTALLEERAMLQRQLAEMQYLQEQMETQQKRVHIQEVPDLMKFFAGNQGGPEGITNLLSILQPKAQVSEEEQAQRMYSQVIELRDEIIALKERGQDEHSDAELEALAEKLIRLEETKEMLYQGIQSKNDLQSNGDLQSKGDLRAALEEAKQMQRTKSLQLKRQEQEVANLQRNVQLLEGKLGSNNSEEESRQDTGHQSSVAVEAGSMRSSEFSDDEHVGEERDTFSDGRPSSQSWIRSVEEERDTFSDTGGRPSSQSWIRSVEEERDTFNDGRPSSQSWIRSVEETSVTAHAGSTSGDFYEKNKAADSDTESCKSVEVSHTMAAPVYGQVQSISVFNNTFIDVSDCSIVMDEISDLIGHMHSQYGNNTRTERDTGRRVINFISKLLDEVREVDITRLDQQRLILRRIREVVNK